MGDPAPPPAAARAGRIALMIAESAAIAPAARRLIAANADRIELVVLSDIAGGDPLSLALEPMRVARWSGLRFVKYILYTWGLYFLVGMAERGVARLARRQPRYADVEELCQRHGIECVTVSSVSDPSVVGLLRSRKLDIIITFQFDQLLTSEVITTARTAVLNVHPSYLPNGRGKYPAIARGAEPEAPTGVTVHLIVDRGVDTGPILRQERVPLSGSDSLLRGEARLFVAGAHALQVVLDDLPAHLAAQRRQDGGTYYSDPTREQVANVTRLGIALATVRDVVDLALAAP